MATGKFVLKEENQSAAYGPLVWGVYQGNVYWCEVVSRSVPHGPIEERKKTKANRSAKAHAEMIASALNDLPSLVFADWLEEQGELRAAELLRKNF